MQWFTILHTLVFIHYTISLFRLSTLKVRRAKTMALWQIKQPSCFRSGLRMKAKKPARRIFCTLLVAWRWQKLLMVFLLEFEWILCFCLFLIGLLFYYHDFFLYFSMIVRHFRRVIFWSYKVSWHFIAAFYFLLSGTSIVKEDR